MNNPEPLQKITSDHLTRKAIVYLRQSSLQQVRHNTESQRLQYALVDRAKALGVVSQIISPLISQAISRPMQVGFPHCVHR